VKLGDNVYRDARGESCPSPDPVFYPGKKKLFMGVYPQRSFLMVSIGTLIHGLVYAITTAVTGYIGNGRYVLSSAIANARAKAR
jgi:hypothetical protein